MAARLKNSTADWDPMGEDYRAQYTDNDNEQIQLDHTKLYVTSFPRGLTEDGLKAALSKYGHVEHCFISKNPNKKFALVTFETAAEARIAMMKLNKMPPLNLSLSIAYKKDSTSANETKKVSNDEYSQNSYKERTLREHSGSVGSRKSRNNTEDHITVDDMEPQPEDDMGVDIDHSLHLQLEQMKLEQLRVKEEQLRIKQKILVLQQHDKHVPSVVNTPPSNRRILSDGRIVVNTSAHKAPEADMSYSPASESKWRADACLACGVPADLYCARCGLAPYCGAACQARDWRTRHSAVCHNLMRLSKPSAANKASESTQPSPKHDYIDKVSVPTPLRRPHSPSTRLRMARTNNDNHNQSGVSPSGRGGSHAARNTPRTHAPENGHHSDKHHANATEYKSSPKDSPRRNVPKTVEAEEPKKVKEPAKVAEQVKVAEQTKVAEQMKVAQQTKVAEPMKVAEPTKIVEAVKQNKVEVTPKIKLVPEMCVIEALSVGEWLLLSVESDGSAIGAGAGCVCVCICERYGQQYESLVDQYAADCEKEKGKYTPAIGDTFSYFNPSDAGWYRARRVNTDTVILIDAAKTAALGEQRVCALPAQYSDVPEFSCVIDMAQVVGTQLKCVLLSKSATGVRVSVSSTDDTPLGEATLTRWLPAVQSDDEVKKPAAPNPIAEAKPIAAPQPIAAPKPAAAPKPIAEPKPIATPQPIAAPKPAAEPKLIAEAKPVAAPKPIAEAKPIADTKHTAPNQNAQEVTRIIPSVTRPVVKNNGRYVLLDVTSLKRACIRPCEEEDAFNSVLQDGALAGITAGVPLKEPPTSGQLVLGLYQEAHYRALVLRTKAADNRYKIEYIEYGNQEIVPLERLFECPTELDLTHRPTVASIVELTSSDVIELTSQATDYINTVKESEELIVSIPGDAATAPSGALVTLTLTRNKHCLNTKLEQMCTPHWKQLEQNGGDVVQMECIMFSDMKHISLPTERSFTLQVTEHSQLQEGALSGYERGAPLADVVYGPLTDKINAYAASALCREPYLPKLEELCIAPFPPFPQWFRAVLLQQPEGPGGATAQVMYLDYGNVSAVPVASLRKMLSEFTAQPALANYCTIKDWPESLTGAQLRAALEYLKLDEEGRGVLTVSCAVEVDSGVYTIHAPGLIQAINNA